MELALIEDLVWCILWHYPLVLAGCLAIASKFAAIAFVAILFFAAVFSKILWMLIGSETVRMTKTIDRNRRLPLD